MIRIFIVAASASVRAGLEALLSDADDVRVVGRAARAEAEALRLSEAAILLLDARPGDAAAAADAVRGSAVRVVMLGDAPEEGVPLRTSTQSVWAWLRKEAEADEILAALRAVAAGLIALEPTHLPWVSGHASPMVSSISVSNEALTPREREVLQLMAQGLPNKQIAARLSISTHTVKFHVAAVLAKLGAASRTEAVTLGIRRGDVLV